MFKTCTRIIAKRFVGVRSHIYIVLNEFSFQNVFIRVRRQRMCNEDAENALTYLKDIFKVMSLLGRKESIKALRKG